MLTDRVKDIDNIHDGDLWHKYCEDSIDYKWFYRFLSNNKSFRIHEDCWFKGRAIELLNRQLQVIRHMKGKVLDVGSNTGVLVLRLRQMGIDAHGVDAAETFVKISMAYASLFKHDPRIFKLGLVQKLPYEDVAFDSVHCQETLEHLPSTVDALKEIHRVLKPNGMFAGGVPYKEDPHHHPGHFVYFDEGIVRNMLDPYFKVEKMKVEGSEYPNNHRKSKKDSKQLLWVARKK